MAAPGSRDDLIDRLRLIRTERVGPVGFRQLVARFGSAAAALDALPDVAARAGGAALRPCTAAVAQAELARIEALGGRLLCAGLPPYPPLLARIDDAPPVIGALGDLRLLERPVVAVVGARNASAAGLKLARQMAHDLTEAGVAVASGMARGIDSAAHEGALPATVAALAGGLDVFAPPEVEPLQRRLASEGGLLLAENPPGTQPQARHFPRRNRIISGLALGVVVVEAAHRSGSLLTARMAADQSRDVMAVPGSPLDPRAAGPNSLIRDGATLVRDAADVLELIQPFRQRPASPAPTLFDPGPAEAPADLIERVAGLLGPTPVALDALAREAGITGAELASALTDLELAGRAERHAGGRVALPA
jgi:DNA processing protein